MKRLEEIEMLLKMAVELNQPEDIIQELKVAKFQELYRQFKENENEAETVEVKSEPLAEEVQKPAMEEMTNKGGRRVPRVVTDTNEFVKYPLDTDYKVSADGRVLSALNRELTQSITHGKVVVSLKKKAAPGFMATSVAVMVAKTFGILPLTGSYRDIIHKDGDSTNCHLNNLTTKARLTVKEQEKAAEVKVPIQDVEEYSESEEDTKFNREGIDNSNQFDLADANRRLANKFNGIEEETPVAVPVVDRDSQVTYRWEFKRRDSATLTEKVLQPKNFADGIKSTCNKGATPKDIKEYRRIYRTKMKECHLCDGDWVWIDHGIAARRLTVR